MADILARRARTHRSVANWLWCIVFAAIAVTLPILAIRDAQQHAEVLRHRGVRVTADVLDSRGKSSEVIFVDQSHGTPKVETQTLSGYYHIGKKLNVVYDPQHPSTIDVENHIGIVREYLVRVPLIVVALAAALGAVAVFRHTRPTRRA